MMERIASLWLPGLIMLVVGFVLTFAAPTLTRVLNLHERWNIILKLAALTLAVVGMFLAFRL